jgi:adenylate cyclase class IV
MRLPSSNVQNKSLEIERKYSLDPPKWDQFIKQMKDFHPDKEKIAEGPDTYYQNGDVVLRWRNGTDLSQLTIKSRYSLRSSIVREEIEVDLSENTARMTIGFIKSLGFKKLFRIHKKCHIFWITNPIGEACIVAYKVACKGRKERYFIEIEAQKGMSVYDSKKLIDFWEKRLKIAIPRRLNETLFEIYSGQTTRLIDKKEKIL